MYNDVEDPQNPGYALLPARGTLTNDMGCFGGPNSLWWSWEGIVSSVDDKLEYGVPTDFTLLQNYPNPFNPITTIEYSIPQKTIVEVAVYNLTGQRIETLVNTNHSPGNFKVIWNGSNQASAVYVYQIKADKFVQSKKVLLIK